MNYSYNPTQINDGWLNQMRFELGDTFVMEPEKTAYLSDEEYVAALKGSKTWRRAKFRCVETLLRRFSYEVDTKVQNAEWKLSDRLDEWRRLYNQLKGGLEAEEITGGLNGLAGASRRPPIFRVGMNDRR